VIGVGDAATQAALNSDPAHTLAQSPSFSAASTALGGDASLYASVAGLLPLITTNIATDPQLQQLEPYLKRLAFLTAGSGDSGLRVALGANK
jgi:hypothetical protein